MAKKEDYKDSNPLTITATTQEPPTETVVYVAGYEHNSSRAVAKYWRNGNPVILTDGSNSAYAHSIAVVYNDVYVAGYEEITGGKHVAKYWKNGNLVTLTDGSMNGYAESIVVVNNDVYVAGYEENISRISIAKYWKNGNPINLTDGGTVAEANSIVVIRE